MKFFDALREIIDYANSKGIAVLNQEPWTIFQKQTPNCDQVLLKIPRRKNTDGEISKNVLLQWKEKIDDCDKEFANIIPKIPKLDRTP